MVVIGGADETVVGDVHQLPQVQNALFTGDDVVNELLGSDACFLCLLFNLLAVLVSTGQELDVVALQTLVAGHGIGCHGAVSVTDMELGRGIVNGGCNVVITLRHNLLPPKMKKRP